MPVESTVRRGCRAPDADNRQLLIAVRQIQHTIKTCNVGTQIGILVITVDQQSGSVRARLKVKVIVPPLCIQRNIFGNFIRIKIPRIGAGGIGIPGRYGPDNPCPAFR